MWFAVHNMYVHSEHQLAWVDPIAIVIPSSEVYIHVFKTLLAVLTTFFASVDMGSLGSSLSGHLHIYISGGMIEVVVVL